MINKKRVTKIVDSLNTLKKKDNVYSLMLFTLYKMHDIREYSTLSELAYLLDGENLTKLLSYYGGLTVTIPTLAELRLMVQALTIYQYVNVEGGSFEDALKASSDEFSEDSLKSAYQNIVDALNTYEFDQ